MSNIIKAIKEIYPNIEGGFVYWETKQDGTPLDNPIDGLKWENAEYDKPSWSDIEAKLGAVELENAKDAKIEICREYLKKTDWHCLRFADDGNSYPVEIKDKRIFARSASNAIEALTSIEEVEAYDINNIID